MLAHRWSGPLPPLLAWAPGPVAHFQVALVCGAAIALHVLAATAACAAHASAGQREAAERCAQLGDAISHCVKHVALRLQRLRGEG